MTYTAVMPRPLDGPAVYHSFRRTGRLMETVSWASNDPWYQSGNDIRLSDNLCSDIEYQGETRGSLQSGDGAGAGMAKRGCHNSITLLIHATSLVDEFVFN